MILKGFAAIMFITIGTILILLLVGYLFIWIPKYGFQFLILKCPNCNRRGGLKKTWEFSTKKEIKDESVIDDDLEIKKVKALICKKCDHKLSL